LLLVIAAGLALALANTQLASVFDAILHWELGPPLPRVGRMTMHLWVADGLMAVFFLLVGLEVKREWFEGRLSTAETRRLPIIAAIAGMGVPALVFLIVTRFDPALVRGWAIPAATDIAFAIAILAVLGRHAPASVKVLLVTIAIVDDIGAVLIIALAYSDGLSGIALAAVTGVVAAMGAMNLYGVRKIWPYMLAFVGLWLLVLASGVHATIAGVLAALTVPLGRNEKMSPLKRLEHSLHPWVMFGVVPIFGFVSAGVPLTGGVDVLLNPLPLGIILGLFIGKQLGVYGGVRLAVVAGVARLPEGIRWSHIYGAAVLCGIGFTMSLFIGALAFPGDAASVDAAKIGTLVGSLLSAVVGWSVFRFGPSNDAASTADEEEAALFGKDQNDHKS
jgi:NhaA family Na+:H+ antiporter